MILAKSKKLLREVKWFGRRMSLHSRYWISLSGRPSAYLPGFTSRNCVTLLFFPVVFFLVAFFSVVFFSVFFFAARLGIVFLNVPPRGRRPCGAAPSESAGDESARSWSGNHPIV